MSEELKTISIRNVREVDHRSLKKLSAKENLPMSEILEKMIKLYKKSKKA